MVEAESGYSFFVSLTLCVSDPKASSGRIMPIGSKYLYIMCASQNQSKSVKFVFGVLRHMAWRDNVLHRRRHPLRRGLFWLRFLITSLGECDRSCAFRNFQRCNRFCLGKGLLIMLLLTVYAIVWLRWIFCGRTGHKNQSTLECHRNTGRGWWL